MQVLGINRLWKTRRPDGSGSKFLRNILGYVPSVPAFPSQRNELAQFAVQRFSAVLRRLGPIHDAGIDSADLPNYRYAELVGWSTRCSNSSNERWDH